VVTVAPRSLARPRVSSRLSPRSAPTAPRAKSSGSTWLVLGHRTTRGGLLRRQLEATAEEAAALIQPHPSLSETLVKHCFALAGRGLHLG